jgi:uncharacterized protein YjbI with pentapeptide repeats
MLFRTASNRRATAASPSFARIAAILALLASASVSRADIYQWQWVNPNDPGQGKTASSIVCPGGSGVSAVPGANLSSRNLTQAYLDNKDLTSANCPSAIFANATLVAANLSKADLRWCNFTGADVAGTTITEARFNGSNLAAGQLYSTASYQSGNLYGTTFPNSVAGWNFAGKNLTHAYFQFADVNGANFTGATIAESSFDYSNLTAAQLYSTASYQNYDIHRLFLRDHDMSGWNLANQNLSYSLLQGSRLIGTDLHGANLSNAGIYDLSITGANLTGANLNSTDFSRSDMRGAIGASLSSAITRSTILPDGTIHGNNWENGLGVTFRNTTQNIPVRVVEKWTLDPQVWLNFSLDAQPWKSTISFDPGINVALGGELALSPAEGLDPRSLVGKTYRLFDWSGASRTGTFSKISDNIYGTSYYRLDASRLYTAGEIRFLPVPEPSNIGMIASVALSLLAYGIRAGRTGKLRR